MKYWTLLISLFLVVFILAACGGDDDKKDEEKSDPTATPTQAVEPTASREPTPPEDTEPSITDTPMNTADLPAIELLGGAADSCVIIEGYSELVGYDAMFYETTTDNAVKARLLDADDNVLADEDYSGENKDGEEGWGWYPPIYEVADHSVLTLEITVYLSGNANAAVTSISTLSYDCTSGETITKSFLATGH